MNRDKRFESIFARAVPDHRLMPALVDELGKQPRNIRRYRKRIMNAAWPKIYSRMRADLESGAGFPIDQQLREFALEYNDRQLGHGLLTLPSSFNVFEGFLDFKVVPPFNLFILRPEKDHLFSLSDFLDFATGSDRPVDVLAGVATIPEGLINNYTPVGDIHDLAFLHADSNRFVVGGATMIRHGDQLHWAMIGGPILDLEAKTAELRAGGADLTWQKNRPWHKRFIKPATELDVRAEPLQGTVNVWKTVVFGRFNILTRRHESRNISVDNGNYYRIISDDLEMIYGPMKLEDLTPAQTSALKTLADEIEREALLFEIAETLFLLPEYFRFKIKLVREQERSTGLSRMTPRERRAVASAPSSAKVLVRRVATLEIIDPGREPLLRTYLPPRFRVEVEGFWRRLSHPTAIGKDALGKAVRGQTWVKGHLRWRDRPERTSTIYIKNSIAVAKAKAAALIASDPSSFSIVGDVPEIVEAPSSRSSTSGGWLYVMRCPLMEEDIFKVGWTSKSPKARAEELSKATGVPLSFVVVESWKVSDPKLAETMAHEALNSFRITGRREFFKASYDVIRNHVSAVVSAVASCGDHPD